MKTIRIKAKNIILNKDSTILQNCTIHTIGSKKEYYNPIVCYDLNNKLLHIGKHTLCANVELRI